MHVDQTAQHVEIDQIMYLEQTVDYLHEFVLGSDHGMYPVILHQDGDGCSYDHHEKVSCGL